MHKRSPHFISMNVQCLLVLFCCFVVALCNRRNCEKWRREALAKRGRRMNRTDEAAGFGRGGYPEPTVSATVGSTVKLVCNHLTYLGDSPHPPIVSVVWLKDGRRLREIANKKKIDDCIKKPFIFGTRLTIFKASPIDSGNYTCKYSIVDKNAIRYEKNTSDNIAVFVGTKRNVTVYRRGWSARHLNTTTTRRTTRKEYGKESTTAIIKIIAESEWNKELTALVIVSSFCCVFLIILLVSLCSAEQSCPYKVYLAVTGQKRPVQKGPAACPADTGLLEDGVRFYNGNKDMDEEPTYINNERYRDLFPFINEEEWGLLEQNRIDRNSVLCGVQYSMPIVLGTGNFGHVYRGELTMHDGSKKMVAVKRLNDGYKPRELGHFLSEAVTLLKAGQHCNVVTLVGSSLLDALGNSDRADCVKKPPILLMELASEGNLKNYLYERRLDEASVASLQRKNGMTSTDVAVGKGISLKDLTSFSYQAARGMEHLASKKIIHRDLAARNVLLTSDRVVKIADFGLSKHMQNEYYKVHAPAIAPAKWTAPEALWENKFSIKSDVWSYGVLVWEIFSMGEQPYLGVPAQILYRKLSSGLRLGKPRFSNTATYSTLRKCWSWKPETRPTFTELVQYFDAALLCVAQAYMDLGQPCDSLVTSTDSISQNSEAGSDSVFDYSEMMSVAIDPRMINPYPPDSSTSAETYKNTSAVSMRSATLESKDSACIMHNSGGSVSTVSEDTAAEFTFSELINPLYEVEAVVD
ncbi:uncharacterized protein LOC101242971 [Ciona intestinalis]